jgi:hypothetical protein
VVWDGQVETEQDDDGADQPLGLTQGQTEHGPKRQGRGAGQHRILRLPAPGGPGLDLPGRDRHIREPDGQTASPAY